MRRPEYPPDLPILIIVSGPSATGKTTLSKYLAGALAVPLINRDSIKEILFDTLGWTDRAWSKKLGGASYHLLYYCLDVLLSTHRTCLVESNFDAAYDTHKVQALLQKHHFAALQILCRTDPEILARRFRARSESGERHPGHVDHIEAATLDVASIQGWSAPLDLGGSVIEVDTSYVDPINYEQLLAQVQQYLSYPKA